MWLLSIAAVSLLYFTPHVINGYWNSSPLAQAAKPLLPAPEAALPGMEATRSGAAEKVSPQELSVSTGEKTRQRKLLSTWLSRRYRIAGDAGTLLVGAAYDAANNYQMAPLLILSVMCIKSRLNPYAESETGARGLIQVATKNPGAATGGQKQSKDPLDPVDNIRLGAKLLKEEILATGSVQAGLKNYLDGAGEYAKMLVEHSKLKAMLAQ
ncbi:transglycosylase SLT domain-containing protein [Undibacterium sp.]|uniref:transglycosylase SLT domain-containing protein n=1 Tax=Undibacterium sp. TaxID=1914977 RepID=UPI002731B0D2|nr:transglycosylase SLT domain-containing protein [Undibacterium sp.]MDP1976393.1 transglycosylase SLT domain-containing protein [Undibacterium sp.]